MRSVTANTRRDGEAFLTIAASMGLSVETIPYRFDDADQALRGSRRAIGVTGAAVIRVGEHS